MCQLSVVESKSATFPSEKARHLLDDSVLESRSPRRGLALTSSSAVTNGLSLGKRLSLHMTAGGPQPGVCSMSVSVTVQCPVAPRPLQKGLPARVTRAREAFAPGLQGFTKCPGFVLILLVALSVAGRLREQPDRCLRPAVIVGHCQSLAAAPMGLLSLGEPQVPVCKSRGSCPGTAAGWATGSSLLCLSSH